MKVSMSVARYDYVLNYVCIHVGSKLRIFTFVTKYVFSPTDFAATPTIIRGTCSYSMRNFHDGCRQNIDRRNVYRIRLRNIT